MNILSRAHQKIQTREKIFATAADLFVKHGIHATKTADVARAAAISHGLVFAHFPTREALVIATLQRMGQRITDRLHTLVHGKSTLRDVLLAHVQSLSEHEPVYRRLLLEGSLLPPACRLLWVGIQSAVSTYITQAAQNEMACGTIRPVQSHLLFNTWVGLLHHYLSNPDLFAPDQSVLSRYGTTLLTHYLELLAPCSQGESS